MSKVENSSCMGVFDRLGLSDMSTEAKKERARYIKKSKELQSQACRIFGDGIVTEAWFCSWVKGYAGEDESEFKDDGGLDIDCGNGLDIMLEFSNGKRVCFSCAEWGGIFTAKGNFQED